MAKALAQLALIQACNLQNLLNLHAILNDKYLRYQMLVPTYGGEEAVEEHRFMFEAALARDAERAVLYLETHVMRGFEHTLDAME